MTTSTWRQAIDTLSRRPITTGILLDFDGTIAPIVVEPEHARIMPEDIALLKRLAEHLAIVAVVSGRPGTFLAERLELVPTSTSHLLAYGRGGLDRVDEHGVITADTSLDHWIPTMTQLAHEARALAPEAFIEEKGIVITLHWRRAPHTEARLRAFIQSRAEEKGLLTRDGKMSIECFPPGAASKATVVASEGATCDVVAYFGDDVGDIDAFVALDNLDDATETLRVCVQSAEVPEELVARADLILENPSTTLAFLRDLERVLNETHTDERRDNLYNEDF